MPLFIDGRCRQNRVDRVLETDVRTHRGDRPLLLAPICYMGPKHPRVSIRADEAENSEGIILRHIDHITPCDVDETVVHLFRNALGVGTVVLEHRSPQEEFGLVLSRDFVATIPPTRGHSVSLRVKGDIDDRQRILSRRSCRRDLTISADFPAVRQNDR